MKIKYHFQKHHLILIGIILIGLFLRSYQLREWFVYGHDHDLASWIVKDIVINKHPRLIGQLTSTPGIFIGPIYYYSLIPFYLLFNMDPIALPVSSVVYGMFIIWSTYFTFSRIINKKVGLIAAFIYAVSLYTVHNDRESVPTTPVIAWTIWYLYSLVLILKNKTRYAFILLGILFGLIWHLNMTLFLLSPLVIIALYLVKVKIKVKDIISGIVPFLLVSLPLIAFETRHGFSQIRSFMLAFTADQGDNTYQGISKIIRVIYLINKNYSGLISGYLPDNPTKYITLLTIVLLFVYLFKKKIISKNISVLVVAWSVIYILFFSLYSKTLSEYYLNGIMVLALVVLSVFIGYLLDNARRKWMGYFILIAFLIINIYRLSLFGGSTIYTDKLAIVEHIEEHSQMQGYECVAVSYLTDPGYELGYRYFYWFEGLKLNHISDHVPVYSIVFPQKPYFETDADFGAIGLIYPDPSIKDNIICEDENTNLTDPMFGYTE